MSVFSIEWGKVEGPLRRVFGVAGYGMLESNSVKYK